MLVNNHLFIVNLETNTTIYDSWRSWSLWLERSHAGRSTRDELEIEGYNKEEAGREFIHPAKEEPVEEDPGPDVGIDADKCRG